MRMYNSNPTQILYPNPGYGQLPAVYAPGVVLDAPLGTTYLLEPSLNGPLETVENAVEMIPGVTWINDRLPAVIPEGVKSVVSLLLLSTAVITAYGVVVKRKSIKKALKATPLGGLMKPPRRRKRRARYRRRNRRNRRNFLPGGAFNPRRRRRRRNRRNRR